MHAYLMEVMKQHSALSFPQYSVLVELYVAPKPHVNHASFMLDINLPHEFKISQFYKVNINLKKISKFFLHRQNYLEQCLHLFCFNLIFVILL